MKGTNGYYASRGGLKNKASASNISTLNDNKSGLGIMMDTSAIEANQSQDYDEFDDVLNSLTKGFRQREHKKSKMVYKQRMT